MTCVRLSWFPIAAVLTAGCASGAAFAADGDLMARDACAFPAYEKLAGRRIEQYASRIEYEQAVGDKKFRCERVTYSSGGLPVIAFVYRSAEAVGRPLPIVVFNRGSYIVNDQLPLLVAMFHRFAEAGFAVIAPMYRGSEGAPGRDEMGGAELADLLNVLPLARRLGFVDLQNVFLYGESRGGVMTLLALREGFVARAAATFGAFTDLAVYLESDPRAKQSVGAIWPEYEQEKEQILMTRSAIRWPERIGAPLLLMHGGGDRQVSPLHTLKLASRLEELGKPYGVVLFAGDNHLISDNRLERDRQAILWFRKHLR